MDGSGPAQEPAVVLVGADVKLRRIVRRGLELDGIAVLEVDSVDQVPSVTLGHEVRGVVLLDTVSADGAALDGMIGTVGGQRAATILQEDAESVADSWRDLCRWDPMLPPETEPPPPLAMRMVRAVADALSRPQPLGWGPDPVIEGVTESFAVQIGSVEVVIGELVCLREAVRRRLQQALPGNEREETLERLTMVIDRAIGVAAGRAARQLEQEALIDPLTGLLNRRALERDLRRELGRADRHGSTVSVMVVDVDGLKLVNDTEGHLAGDQCLRAVALALAGVLRTSDAAYRTGGDEFIVMLPDADRETADLVAARAVGAGSPPFSWGVASFPEEADSVDALIDLADHRLYEQRRHAGRTGHRD